MFHVKIKIKIAASVAFNSLFLFLLSSPSAFLMHPFSGSRAVPYASALSRSFLAGEI